MSIEGSETVVDRMRASFARAMRTPDGKDAPVALLWTDPNREWTALLPVLQQTVPHIFTLGPYAPDKRQGPVIWLKCIVDRALPDFAPADDVSPILYLPRVDRQQLRAASDCDPELQPLIELQYRGEVWHQPNGRDWTVEAFLTSEEPLDLDIARDTGTHDAMLRALPLLAQAPIAGLRGRRLDADDFDRLAIGDPVRELLTWISSAEAVQDRPDTDQWETFREVCSREFNLDPDVDGIQAAASALAEGLGNWKDVWQRFSEAPTLYPGVAKALRQSQPTDLFAESDQSRLPHFNNRREGELRRELEATTGLSHSDACERIAMLDKEHKERRQWVWARLDESPLAVALEPLVRLADAARYALGGETIDAMISDYVAHGWRCDRAALDVLSLRTPVAEQALVSNVVRVLYEPWLDQSARRFQELLAGDDTDPGKLATGVEAHPDTCLLFIDGLRFDLGIMLQERLDSRGLRTRLSHRVAPIPTVTATAKPLASPAHANCKGGPDAENFYPLIADTGRQADAKQLRVAMTGQGIELLKDNETRMAVDSGVSAWTETGNIDSLGHKLNVALVRQIDEQIELISTRINALLNAGWSKVRVVTDHGWLLLPGGLPKVELPPYLVETKWARCAAVKGTSAPSVPTYPWYWNPLLQIASPPGIGAFRVNTEYTHGGVSLQECVVPDLIVERGEAAVAAKITAITWRGMRCRVSTDTDSDGISADLRLNWKQAKTSISETAKRLRENGEASLAVPDDSHEGAAASVVLIDPLGAVLDHKTTTVGDAT